MENSVNILNFFSNWKNWFESLSPSKKALPLVLTLAYIGVIFALDGFERDDYQRYYLISALILFLAYLGQATRKLLNVVLPVLLVIMVYDSFYFYSDFIIGEINIAEPYLLEKSWFGVATASGIVTLNEWFAGNTHWFLDVLTGVVYLMYVFSLVIFSLYLLLVATKKGTARYSGEYISPRVPAVLWAFFVTNMLGYLTWHVYPAAPPWYVEIYGFAEPPPDIAGNVAGLIRFDEFFGIQFFQKFYAKTEIVFGAIPSLHCAYSAVMLFFAYRFKTLRGISVAYFLMMGFSAVYLNHHYVIDVVLGYLYGFAGSLLTDRMIEWRIQKTNRVYQPSSV